MFKTTSNNGFHIQYPNGYVVSMQWEPGNYCSDRNLSGKFRDERRRECEAVEVAAWDTVTGDWVNLGINDEVSGWQGPLDVLAIMNRVSALSPTVVEVLALPEPDKK